MIQDALLELAAGWLQDAGLLRDHGACEAATTTELHARQVMEAVKRAEDDELTLAEAAAESGYSKRRLRELVSEGSIPNAGRKGAPRIRRADLPYKPKPVPNGFDAEAEVRSIVGVGR